MYTNIQFEIMNLYFINTHMVVEQISADIQIIVYSVFKYI